MQQVTIHAAKTNLSKLIEAALAGEEVVIVRGRTPLIQLVPIVRGGFQGRPAGGTAGPKPGLLRTRGRSRPAALGGRC